MRSVVVSPKRCEDDQVIGIAPDNVETIALKAAIAKPKAICRVLLHS
jgi:hypothetical protein